MSAVAIAGMACRYPEADSPDELWQNVLAQRRAFRRLPEERLRSADYWSPDRTAADRTYSAQAAVLEGWEFDRARFRISGPTFRSADLAHWLALEVAADALADAGFPDGAGLDRERTLVVVGNTLTGEVSRAQSLRLRWPYVRRVASAALLRAELLEEERARVLAELEREYKAPFEPVGEDTLAGALSNTIAGRVCNAFDLKGGGYTVDGACASSLLAVVTAAAALERGDADVAIAGGVDLSLDAFELVGFAKAGALAADEMRVYDAEPQGFWPGEGAGFVVLRRLEEGPADVALRGYGVSSDGVGGITRPELEGQLLALRRAYERAAIGIDTVPLFEGHGTGTAIGDAIEIAALGRARAEAGATRRAAIGSVKANIGHTKAAAGVAGLIKAASSLREEVIPPVTGCSNPHPALEGNGSTLRVAREAEPWPARAARRAGVSAMGFGGINVHAVLERVTPSRRRTLSGRERRLSGSAQDSELLLFAGSAVEVAAAVCSVRAVVEEASLAELADLASLLCGRLPTAPGEASTRAAVVASRPSETAWALDALARALAAGEERRFDPGAGIALGSGPAARVGYLFSGQGAPATADGGALARRFGFIQEFFSAAALASDDRTETAFAQPAIVAASLAGLELLERLGVAAEVAVGHSLGELTALHWAGVLSRSDTLELARARGRAMSDLGTRDGAMAAIAADQAVVARLAAGTGAAVAGINGPAQTTVSGPAAAVAAVVEHAERESIAATRLAVSHAFHSELVAGAAAPLRDALGRASIRPPTRRVVSTVTGETLSTDTDVADVLVRQVTSPVLFAPALAGAASAADLLLEVGPGNVLEQLARAAVDIPAVALRVGSESLRSTLFAIAALFAAGRVTEPATLFADRFVRPFRLDAPRRFIANPCEAAPQDAATAAEADAWQPPQPPLHPIETLPDEENDALSVVHAVVAERLELPPGAIDPDARLLGDLHLSSIAVGEIAASAARRLGLAPPAAPGELATATIAELAEALERLSTTAPEPERARPGGIASWTRPFGRVLVERPAAAAESTSTRWRVVAAPDDPLAMAAASAFAGGGEADGVVLVMPDRRDESVLPLLVEAARAVHEGRPDRFALVEAGAVAASFARALHLEEGLDTCVVGVTGARDLERARSEAEAVHGFREVRFDRRGRRLVPVLRPLDLARGRHPLSTGDVVLATGGGKGITAECALGLVEGRGASLAILGRSDPRADEELAAGLRRFDAAGVRHLYVRADVTDRAAVRAAVERVRAELGPVTAILHGAGVNVPTLLPNLDADAYRDTLRPKLEGLRNLVHTVGLESLRLVVGLGSVIATTGLRGEAHYALANEWLRELLEDLGRRNPRCRCLDVEWSVWSGAGMGERLGTVDALARAGIDAISPADGIPLLEELVSAPALPPTVVATGRIGDLPTVELERVKLPLLRFLERPVVAVPNVELVVEAELSVATDPYVRDHVLDGVQLLPAVVGLEAMAEASATLLGGREPRTFEAVEFARPVTVPADGSRRIRIAALRRRDGAVDVAVRSDETGFQADHFRATCRPVTGRAEWRVDVVEGRAPLEPDDVYDLLLFHGSRFRRLRGYRRLAARSCEADVEVRADARWFGEFLPQRLVLGDLGARDAVVHALQACIPDTRVLPVGVDRLVVRRLPREAAVVSARERADDGETLVWDLDVRDRSGHLCERWEGLKLQRLGGPRQPPRWPRALLVPLLERGIARAAGVPVGVGISGARPEADVAIAYAVGRPVRVERQPNGRPVVAGKQVSAAHVAGLTLAVAAEVPVACDVEEAASRGEAVWRDLLGRDRFELAGRLAAELGGEFDQSAARVWAAAECARKAGRPTREPLALATQAENGWTLLRAGDLAVATYAARVVDLETPLAFAVLVGNGR